MRKVYAISYDFKQPDPDRYAGFFDQLTKFGSWWHYLNDIWLIATDLTANEILAKLQPYLDEDVNILVAEMGSDVAGWLPKKAWEWITTQQEELSAAVQFTPSVSG